MPKDSRTVVQISEHSVTPNPTVLGHQHMKRWRGACQGERFCEVMTDTASVYRGLANRVSVCNVNTELT